MEATILEKIVSHGTWLAERCKADPNLIERLKGFGEEITLTFNPNIPAQLQFRDIAITCPKLSTAMDSGYCDWSAENPARGLGRTIVTFDDETGPEFLGLLESHILLVCRHDVTVQWDDQIKNAASKLYDQLFS